MTAILNLFSGNSAKNPERLIETIKDLKIQSKVSNQFYLVCAEENAKLKTLLYETKDANTASYVFAKLSYLM